MSKAAWDGLEPKPGAPPVAGQEAPPKREIVMAEGQPVTLGDTSIIPVAIPGHTPGSLGFVFPVKDGGRIYMAGLFGGSILNPQRRFPAATFEQYITSIEHFAAVTRQHKVEVELLNHPIMDGLFEKLAMIRTRKPGGAHPPSTGLAVGGFLRRGQAREGARADLRHLPRLPPVREPVHGVSDTVRPG